MGRPKKADSRRSKAEKRRAQKAAEAGASLGRRDEPNAKVIERREAFSFLYSGRKLDGRQGSIDQDIHDGIGQLHALGYLDGQEIDGKDLRDIGREFAEMYWDRYSETAPKCGQFERQSRGTGSPPPRTAKYDYFNRLDSVLPRVGMERTVLHMLLTNHFHSDRLEGWVQRLINYQLAKKGAPNVLVDTFSYAHDLLMLGYALRGLAMLFDASRAPKMRRAA